MKHFFIKGLVICSFAYFAGCNNLDEKKVIMCDENLKEEVAEIAKRVADRFMSKNKLWGNYTLDLTHEAMLEYGMATGKGEFDDYIFSIFDKRKWTPDTVNKWKSQPFGHINYCLYRKTKDKRYIKPFVDESIKCFNELTRSDDGLVLHESSAHSARGNVLVDFFQDYIARMAETGKFTGDEKYYKECVEQYRLHRKVLRNPQNNLWSTGRGWHKDINESSGGYWSRGHGWLISGLVKSLCVLPRDTQYYKEMQGYLIELADALLAVQDDNGMWHKMLDFDFDKSPAEMSGTAFICANLLKAINHGILTDEKYKKSALLAFKGMQKYITKEGIVNNVDKRGGPLKSMEGYLDNSPDGFDDGAGHSPSGIINVCAEIIVGL